MEAHDEEIDFNGIDEDLEQFQQDDIVRQALLQGVDLRGYARDIDLELREVCTRILCVLLPLWTLTNRSPRAQPWLAPYLLTG